MIRLNLIICIAVALVLALGALYFVFSVLVPRMSGSTATFFLGAVLALWVTCFFPIAVEVIKRMKL